MVTQFFLPFQILNKLSEFSPPYFDLTAEFLFYSFTDGSIDLLYFILTTWSLPYAIYWRHETFISDSVPVFETKLLNKLFWDCKKFTNHPVQKKSNNMEIFIHFIFIFVFPRSKQKSNLEGPKLWSKPKRSLTFN